MGKLPPSRPKRCPRNRKAHVLSGEAQKDLQRFLERKDYVPALDGQTARTQDRQASSRSPAPTARSIHPCPGHAVRAFLLGGQTIRALGDPCAHPRPGGHFARPLGRCRARRGAGWSNCPSAGHAARAKSAYMVTRRLLWAARLRKPPLKSPHAGYVLPR